MSAPNYQNPQDQQAPVTSPPMSSDPNHHCPQEQQQNSHITAAPPQYGEHYNEKVVGGEHPNGGNPITSPQQQQQQGYFTPQKDGQQGHPQQNGHPQQGQPMNHYQAATPIQSVQSTPAVVDCPACGRREVTRTEYVSGGTTHGLALLLCFCFCLGCIPYMASWFKDVEHRCGQCNVHLATWHRSGRTEVLALRSGPGPQA